MSRIVRSDADGHSADDQCGKKLEEHAEKYKIPTGAFTNMCGIDDLTTPVDPGRL